MLASGGSYARAAAIYTRAIVLLASLDSSNVVSSSSLFVKRASCLARYDHHFDRQDFLCLVPLAEFFLPDDLTKYFPQQTYYMV